MSGKMLTAVANVGLGEILKTKRLIVPPNQRDYSWTTKEVVTLFQDLAAAIQEREDDYFLGTVVVVEKGENSFEIVDGQQRLSTTALLLAAMRDYLRTRPDDANIASTIQDDFLTAKSENMRDREPRIRMNLADNQYFIGLLDGQPKGHETQESHFLLRAAYEEAVRHVRKIVGPLDQTKHGELLVSWAKFIQYRAQVVMLTISSEGNAYRMFETLNDRGLKTTQADLVKNYLFGRAGDRLSEAQEKWASMRSTLETLDEDLGATVTFLRHALMLKHGYFRENTLHDVIQRSAKTTSEVVALIDDMDRWSGMYAAMFNPISDVWAEYPHSHASAINALDVFRIAGFRPLMLAVSLRFDPKNAASAFRMFVNWSVRFTITGNTLTGGTIEVPLAAAAKKVFDRDISSAADLRNELLSRIPTDEQFQQAFAIASVSRAALARYYLRCLERTAAGVSDPEFIPNDDASAVNLEHVLPERPQGNWPEFQAADVKLYAKRIGNLALLGTKMNSDLKSGRFMVKRDILKVSPFALTAQIGQESEWTRDLIIARQAQLAVLAVKTWPA